MKGMRPRAGLALSLTLMLLAGCATGPEYRRPELPMPASWATEAPWREGRPDDAAAKGRWWLRYGDPALDALQARALENSPTLALAGVRIDAEEIDGCARDGPVGRHAAGRP